MEKDKHQTTPLDRHCFSCNQTLPHEAFYKFQRGRYGLSNYCIECTKTKSKESYHKRKTSVEFQKKQKNWQYKSMYGITTEERDQLLKQQEGLCAICKKQLTDSKATHTDHCHLNGNVRGILCRACNHGLGHFEDSVERLKAAINYLGDNNKSTP